MRKLTKVLSGVLASSLIFSAICVIPTKAAPQNGWVSVGGKDYWYENGIKQGTEGRGMEIFDPDSNAWYWLDAVQYGAKTTSKDVYQESEAGPWADRADGTGKWVCYDENGHMIKGWSKKDGNIYYFDPVYGTMAKGCVTINETEYFFNEVTGILERPQIYRGLSGWHLIDGKCYWYPNGALEGWNPFDASYRGKEIYDSASDAWYWLDAVQGGAKTVNKDVYQESEAGPWGDYVNENGVRCGKWVRYDANGHMVKGWQRTEEGVFYFDPVYGTMAKGDCVIDGQEYHFDSVNGSCTTPEPTPAPTEEPAPTSTPEYWVVVKDEWTSGSDTHKHTVGYQEQFTLAYKEEVSEEGHTWTEGPETLRHHMDGSEFYASNYVCSVCGWDSGTGVQ